MNDKKKTYCARSNCWTPWEIKVNACVWNPRGDKVSLFTFIYSPHRTLRNIKYPSTITRLTAHFNSICGLMSNLVVCKHRKRAYGHTLPRMSLLRPGVIKQHKVPPTPTPTPTPTPKLLHNACIGFCLFFCMLHFHFGQWPKIRDN